MATEIADSVLQNEMCISRLARWTGVDLNAVAATNLKTVPPGKRMLVTGVHLKDLLDDALLAVASFGQTGDKDDWAGPLALGEYLEAAGDAVVLTPKMPLIGSDTWDAGSIANGAEEAKEITVTGAALGDLVVCSHGVDVADLVLRAQVTAANTVTAILANNTGGAIDLASATIRAMVTQWNRKVIEYTAGEIFCIDVTTAAGAACTATVDVLGLMLDE